MAFMKGVALAVAVALVWNGVFGQRVPLRNPFGQTNLSGGGYLYAFQAPLYPAAQRPVTFPAFSNVVASVPNTANFSSNAPIPIPGVINTGTGAGTISGTIAGTIPGTGTSTGTGIGISTGSNAGPSTGTGGMQSGGSDNVNPPPPSVG